MAAANAQRLWQLITGHRLDQRKGPSGIEWATIRTMIEADLLPEDVARDYLLLIEEDVQWALDHPNYLHRLPPDTATLYPHAPPDFTFASLVQRPEIRVGLDLLHQRFVCVAGSNQAGKTTLIRAIIHGIIEMGRRDPTRRISLIIFDRNNGEYGYLKSILGDDCLHLCTHDPGMHIGLNPPAGLEPEIWIPAVGELLGDHSEMVEGRTVFTNATIRLIGTLNFNPSSPPRFPSLQNVSDLISRLPAEALGDKAPYVQTLASKLRAPTATPLFKCRSGLDLVRDVIVPHKSLVIEMKPLTPSWVREFAVDLLMAQVFYARQACRHLADRTEVMFVLDEADEDYSSSPNHHTSRGMSMAARIWRKGRALGIGGITGYGQVQRADHYILSESHYLLIGSHGDARSMAFAADCLGLPPRAGLMLPGLRPGEFLFRQTQCAWPHTMLVKGDYIS